MKVKFKRLEVIDFQKLRNFTHDFKDGVTLFKAKNGVGKTTILNAISWCLTGKNLNDQADKYFDVLPMDKDNNYIKDTKPTVTLTITVESDKETKEYVFQRKYIQYKNSSKREYFINGMSMKKQEFDGKIEELFGSGEMYKLLTNINHFTSNLSESEQREIIMDVIDPVTHDDMIGIDERFSKLKELHDVTFEKGFSNAKTKRNNLKKELEEVKNFIKENATTLSNYDFDADVDFERLVEKRKITKEKIEKYRIAIKQKSNLSDEISTLKIKIERIQNKIDNFDKEFDRKIKNKSEEIEYKIRRKESEIGELNIKLKNKTDEYYKIQSQIKNVEAEVKEELVKVVDDLEKEKRNEIKSETSFFDKKIADKQDALSDLESEELDKTCSVCGQDLPQGEIAEIEEKQSLRIISIKDEIKTLKEDKATKIKSIESYYDGKIEDAKNPTVRIGERTHFLQAQINKIKTSGKELKQKRETEKEYLKKLQGELEDVKKQTPDTKEKDLLFDEKIELTKELEELQGGDSEEISFEDLETQEEILERLNNQLTTKDEYEKHLERKNDLQKDKKRKTTALKNQNDKVNLYNEYLQIKNNILSKKIQKYFSDEITFKLLDFTNDGTPKNVFKILVNGINFSTNVNTGHRIKTGIQFASFFQKFYKKYVPILIDEKTSMSDDIPNLGSQALACVVTQDNKLVIEERGE